MGQPYAMPQSGVLLRRKNEASDPRPRGLPRGGSLTPAASSSNCQIENRPCMIMIAPSMNPLPHVARSMILSILTAASLITVSCGRPTYPSNPNNPARVRGSVGRFFARCGGDQATLDSRFSGGREKVLAYWRVEYIDGFISCVDALPCEARTDVVKRCLFDTAVPAPRAKHSCSTMSERDRYCGQSAKDTETHCMIMFGMFNDDVLAAVEECSERSCSNRGECVADVMASLKGE